MQRRLEEEHALQMSILLAEQEKEQQRLHLVRTKCHRSTFSNAVIFLSFIMSLKMQRLNKLDSDRKVILFQ